MVPQLYILYLAYNYNVRLIKENRNELWMWNCGFKIINLAIDLAACVACWCLITPNSYPH